MIDVLTHKIIDMIPSRNSKIVSSWLKTFPNIKILSRDGSLSYKSAISKAFPNAQQISDRFHLLKNLSDGCREFLKNYFKPKILFNTASIIENDSTTNELQAIQADLLKQKLLTVEEKFWAVKRMIKMGHNSSSSCKKLKIDIRTFKKIDALNEEEKKAYFLRAVERRHNEVIVRKQRLIQNVKELSKANTKVSQIAQELNLDIKTVKKYLSLDKTEIRNLLSGSKRISLLDNYNKMIGEGVRKGLTCRQIYSILLKKEYSGSERNLRSYIANWKRDNREVLIAEQESKKVEWINRKSLLALCYKTIEKTGIPNETFRKICDKFPVFEKIYDLIKNFRDILKNGKAQFLQQWLLNAEQTNIPQLQTFVRGIKRDFNAVKNAATYSYSNGLAEGFINKLKLIKRVMYGRNNFKTLKLKTLLIQKFL
jgi:transposase